jgi:hypothetical protein
MKKRNLILLSFFLILSITFIVGDVKINEVELNPEGSDSGNEWVELFNDGAKLNLTGWYLQNKKFDNYSLYGEIDSYYVLDSLSGLTNSNQNISLFNSSNFLIDLVIGLNDGYDDNRTWQRIPDGTGNFSFKDSTKGFSNDEGNININGVGNYATIQEAINYAKNGDVVNVRNGIYIEDLVVNKSVEIIGDNVTIIGSHIVSESNVKLKEINFSTSSTAISIDSSQKQISNIEIKDSFFDLSNSPSIGIYLDGVVNKVSGIVIENSIFEGPNDKVCNPWKIGGDFVNPLSAEINDLKFLNNKVSKCSIPINLHNKDISNILIEENVFENTDGVVYIWDKVGENPQGVLSGFEFLNNSVDGTNTYGIGIDVVGDVFDDSNFGVGNKINFNEFGDITGGYGLNVTSVLANLTNYQIDAKYNYWNYCDGPQTGDVVGNVDYSQWIGACVNTVFKSQECSIEGEEMIFYANVSGELCIGDVKFNLEYLGNSENFTGALVGENYQVNLNGSYFKNGNYELKVYVDDCYSHVDYTEEDFYVNAKTNFSVSPNYPDGNEGFYVSEPLFSLENNDAENIWYQWDSYNIIPYSSDFGLENAPNNWNQTGGIGDLKFWGEFVCGNGTRNESINVKDFNFDFSNPVFNNIYPSNGSKIEGVRPEISVLVKDLYGDNSGINESSIELKIDDSKVLIDIENLSEFEKEVSYTPLSDLSNGVHSAEIYAKDFAGRESSVRWYFTINFTSLIEFKINSPEPLNYQDRRILINIESDKYIDEITYEDLAEERPRERALCKRCGRNYERSKYFKDGFHNVIFRAWEDEKVVEEKRISFFVDSYGPRIYRTEPRRGFSEGNFGIEFREDNPKKLILFYGDKNKTLNISEECELERRRYECKTNVNLSEFDGEEIKYWFELEDIVNNKDVSRIERVKVDTSAPVLLNENDFWERGEGRRENYVYLNLEINEENFKEVTLGYEYRGKIRERTICRSLRYGKCNKIIRIRDDYSNFNLKIWDEAGNVEEISGLNFED